VGGQVPQELSTNAAGASSLRRHPCLLRTEVCYSQRSTANSRFRPYQCRGPRPSPVGSLQPKSRTARPCSRGRSSGPRNNTLPPPAKPLSYPRIFGDDVHDVALDRILMRRVEHVQSSFASAPGAQGSASVRIVRRARPPSDGSVGVLARPIEHRCRVRIGGGQEDERRAVVDVQVRLGQVLGVGLDAGWSPAGSAEGLLRKGTED
jgi:hypothetical protein